MIIYKYMDWKYTNLIHGQLVVVGQRLPTVLRRFVLRLHLCYVCFPNSGFWAVWLKYGPSECAEAHEKLKVRQRGPSLILCILIRLRLVCICNGQGNTQCAARCNDVSWHTSCKVDQNGILKSIRGQRKRGILSGRD